MIHFFSHIPEDNVVYVSPKNLETAYDAAAELVWVAKGLDLLAFPVLARFLLGEVGIRSLERDLPYLTSAETRIFMQFRKTYHAMLTAWGKGAAKHPTRTMFYQQLNTGDNAVLIFSGWTTIGDRRTGAYFDALKPVEYDDPENLLALGLKAAEKKAHAF